MSLTVPHSSKVCKLMASSLLTTMLLLGAASAYSQKIKKDYGVEYKMTVAKVSPLLTDDAYMEVSFLESARFYRISKTKKKEIRMLLKAQLKHDKVYVRRVSEYTDLIDRIREH